MTTWVLIRHEFSLLRALWIPLSLCFSMPLLALAFVEGGFSAVVRLKDPDGLVQGVDLAAPGLATMFCLMSLSVTGHLFLGEHAWGTWARMRCIGVRTGQIMLAKLSVALVAYLVLFVSVMGSARLIFDWRMRGPLATFATVVALLGLVTVVFGALACTLCRNQAELNAMTYLGALVMAGLGGALTPFETLPSWAQSIAPLVPTYWSVRAFEAVILGGAGLSEVTVELAALAVFAAVFGTLAYILFDEDERRSTWA